MTQLQGSSQKEVGPIASLSVLGPGFEYVDSLPSLDAPGTHIGFEDIPSQLVCLRMWRRKNEEQSSRPYGRHDARVNNPVLAAIGCLILATISGGLSRLIFPHPLVRPSKVHGISLFISPAITGSLMWMIGYALRRRGKQAAQIESFGYGFAFALGRR
jgi:hypothetical protein